MKRRAADHTRGPPKITKRFRLNVRTCQQDMLQVNSQILG